MKPFAMNAEYLLLGYLANALWQIPLVFAAAGGTARLARRNGPVAEHRIWVAAMLLEVAIPACRMDVGGVWREMLTWLFPADRTGAERIGIALATGANHGLVGLHLPAEVLSAVAIAFVGVTVYYAARLAWGLWRTEIMRRKASPTSFEGDAAEIWLRLGADWMAGPLRTPAISLSPAVDGPVTVGLLRPTVVVPPGFLEGLRSDDLEAVLAHELAHVRRRDFAKNLVYEAVSVGVAWHPLARLTRARVAESREIVCDAMAADAVAGRERYARSLLRLASRVAHGAPVRTLHAIGIFDANSFERRVMNLTMKRVEIRTMQRIGIGAACAVVALATCATALALRVEVGPQAFAASTATEDEKSSLKTTMPKLIHQVDAIYPEQARTRKDMLDGSVIMGVTVGKDGSIKALRLVKSLRQDYDKSARAAVKQYRFEPALSNGQPTQAQIKIEVSFHSY